jgi:hypothetical protein
MSALIGDFHDPYGEVVTLMGCSIESTAPPNASEFHFVPTFANPAVAAKSS